MNKQYVEKLAVELKKYGKKKPKKYYAWNCPALNVLDCVLSLNRRYDSFVVPRIRKFKEKYPKLKGLSELKNLINTFGPEFFVESELDYRDPIRAKVLIGVVARLLKIQKHIKGKSEKLRLERWAKKAKPVDYKLMGIRGFGLAGFQYLRMLFGAQTTKPDVHIKRFVSKVTGKNVGDVEALNYLEVAAKKVKTALREVDYIIWCKAARKKFV